MKRYFSLFLFGSLILPLLDMFHTWSGTAYYPHPVFLKMAWWVPIEFGLAAVALGQVHMTIERRFPSPRWFRNSLASSFAIFALSYFISAYLGAHSALQLGLIVLLTAFNFIRNEHSLTRILLACVVAIGGCTFESFLGWSNQFVYSRPDFGYINTWLPFLYLNASIALFHLVQKLHHPRDAV